MTNPTHSTASPTNTFLSRRTAIASGASLAALATFPTLAAVNASPDHELLVLGAQLASAYAEAQRLSDAFEAINQPLHDHAMEVATSMFPHQTHPKQWGELFMAVWEKGRASAQPAYDDTNNAMDAAWEQYDAIAKVVSETPAKTIRGLAVKVDLSRQSYPQIFNCPPADADHRYLRLLVDEIAVLGAA